MYPDCHVSCDSCVVWWLNDLKKMLGISFIYFSQSNSYLHKKWTSPTGAKDDLIYALELSDTSVTILY